MHQPKFSGTRCSSHLLHCLCVVWCLESCTSAEPIAQTAAELSPGSFSATGWMADSRFGHAATLLDDGRVLISGGWFDPDAAPWRRSELYDPTSGTFSRTAGDLTIARAAHTSTALSDGRVILTGGTEWSQDYFVANNTVEIFDPVSSAFSPSSPMGHPRLAHTATVLVTGNILITGGCNPVTGTAELYDPSTSSFTQTGSMASWRCYHTGTLLNDGRVLIVGGWGAASSAEIYDPKEGTFTSAGRTVYPHSQHTATLLPDGNVLIAGGGSAGAEVYDPIAATFVSTGNMFSSRGAHSATLLSNGGVLIAGGIWDVVSEFYNLETGSFFQDADMLTPVVEHTATLLLSGQVFIAGGWTTGAQIYTPGEVTFK